MKEFALQMRAPMRIKNSFFTSKSICISSSLQRSRKSARSGKLPNKAAVRLQFKDESRSGQIFLALSEGYPLEESAGFPHRLFVNRSVHKLLARKKRVL